MTRRAREARLVGQHQDAWRGRAVAVLANAYRGRLQRPWGEGGMLDYVHVEPGDWTAEPWEFPGARRCYVTWPPGQPWNASAWARQWNRDYGYPLYGPPWRWEYHPRENVLVGEVFDLQGDHEGKIHLSERIDYQRFPYRVVIGTCEDGTTLTWDLLEIPHVLMGGSTRFGKSKTLQLMLYHLLAADVVQGLAILDWKRRDFRTFTGQPWDARVCAGMTVAKPDLDANGIPVSLATMELAAEAVLAELGRRILESEDVPEGEDPWRDRLILLAVDEAAATLQREPQPPKEDKSPQAEQVRARNRQRARIEFAIGQVAMLGGALHVHVIAAAQSPRKEFLPGEAVANMQHRMFLGPYQDVAEPVIIFGRDAPDSPPGWKGYGVWRSLRTDTDPNDPYLYFKAFWLPAERIARLVEQRRPAMVERINLLREAA
jgi:hypothetical protein